ncbi:gap-Pol polyprotein [Clonorchis sinensis]|uniref:Gap-Pol polyprotein n=1 Tax=Clonorchis sinensis TaxID=79923 RepID=G7YRG1_CLOSI|nr:gap-Pol polyprotein [Clonorchis sinensis]
MMIPWPQPFEDVDVWTFVEDFEEVAEATGLDTDRGKLVVLKTLLRGRAKAVLDVARRGPRKMDWTVAKEALAAEFDTAADRQEAVRRFKTARMAPGCDPTVFFASQQQSFDRALPGPDEVSRRQLLSDQFVEGVRPALGAPLRLARATGQLSVERLVHLARELTEAPLATFQSQENRQDSTAEDLQNKVDQLAEQIAAVKTELRRHARTSRCYKCGMPGNLRNQCPRTRTEAEDEDPRIMIGTNSLVDELDPGRLVQLQRQDPVLRNVAAALLDGRSIENGEGDEELETFQSHFDRLSLNEAGLISWNATDSDVLLPVTPRVLRRKLIEIGLWPTTRLSPEELDEERRKARENLTAVQARTKQKTASRKARSFPVGAKLKWKDHQNPGRSGLGSWKLGSRWQVNAVSKKSKAACVFKLMSADETVANVLVSDKFGVRVKGPTTVEQEGSSKVPYTSQLTVLMVVRGLDQDGTRVIQISRADSLNISVLLSVIGCMPLSTVIISLNILVAEQSDRIQQMEDVINTNLMNVIIIVIDSMTSVFNTDASLPYNHDLVESLIIKKGIKVDGEGTWC